jgi:hypothetical protein
MLAAILLAALPAQDATRTVDVYRGASVAHAAPELEYRHWDVTDTFLDPAEPDRNFGGIRALVGGRGRVILIRYGDLNRAAGPFRDVRDASLHLTPLGPDRPVLRAVYQVSSPWGEGPLPTFGGMFADKKPTARGAATGSHRRAGEGGVAWQQPGGLGPGDAQPITDARLEEREGGVAVTGLGKAVQAMLDRPYENGGLALVFDNEVEFASSQSASGRPRLRMDLAPRPLGSGPDLSVVQIAPRDGTAELVYEARVKNVGTGRSEGFSATWYVGGRPGAGLDLPKGLEPGESTVLTLRRTAQVPESEAKHHPIGLRIRPLGPDAVAANDALEVHEGAIPLTIRVEEAVAEEIAQRGNLIGSRGAEDWAQEQIRIWNDGYFAQSRYGFAPDGIAQRVALEAFEVVPTGSLAGLSPRPGEALYRAPLGEMRYGFDERMLRDVSRGLGIVDLEAMNVRAEDGRVALQQVGRPVARGGEDRWPGVMGGGDTRYDGHLPAQMNLPLQPVASTLMATEPPEATGLFSTTDVAGWRSGAAGRAGSTGAYMYRMPNVVILRALDLQGRPIADAELSFFQMRGGRIEGAEPAFSLTTNRTGTVSLPNQGGGAQANPFGDLGRGAENGLFLIRILKHGVPEWGWLKAWHLVDAASRGNADAMVLDLRFNPAGGPLDEGDLARDRFVSSSEEIPPARLAALVDGSPGSDVELPVPAGGWIEIDLGRDRTIGEVTLVARGSEFWRRFDIVAYGTGQTAAEAMPWARETDWAWSWANRQDPDPAVPAAKHVAYRNTPLRTRYIRIINRSGEAGALAGIRVVPVRVP